jgi:aryl-alcohol dehydrogenase-like predicted oxidoreductase
MAGQKKSVSSRRETMHEHSPMKTRLFNGTGRLVSEVGLGCWQLGGADWGSIDDAYALEILGAAADSGVTFLDTADVYGDGRSERLIGRFLRERGTQFFVATKLGRTGDLFPDQYTEARVRAATEASLRRLELDALDLTQLHCVPPAVLRDGAIFDWLRKLKDEGKIHGFGASVESVEEAEICLAQEGMESLQIIFNIFRQKPAEKLLADALAKRVAIIVRLPLASGLLSGKMTADTQFAAGDHRNYNRDGEKFNVGETFAGLPYEVGVRLAEEIKSFVPEGFNMAQMAQRWILDHPAVTVIIPGASRPQQARANAAVSNLPPLPAETHTALREFYEKKVASQIRGPY